MNKEALARIKINKLLEEAGWRFLDNENGKANIQLEPNVKIKQEDIDALGENFEKTKSTAAAGLAPPNRCMLFQPASFAASWLLTGCYHGCTAPRLLSRNGRKRIPKSQIS